MIKLSRNIRNLSRTIRSYADLSGRFIKDRVNIGNSFMRISKRLFAAHFPYLAKHVVYFHNAEPEVLTYYYSLGHKIIIKSIKSLKQLSGKKFIRPLPDAEVIIDWEKYLSKEVEIPGLNNAEIRSAIPFQLGILSPYDPGDICFCIRSISIIPQNRYSVSLDYSHVKDIREKLDQYTCDKFYPSKILSETHIWEEFLKLVMSQTQYSEEDSYLYIIFKASCSQLGIIGRPLNIPPKMVHFGGEKDLQSEAVYNSMLTFLAGIQNKSSLGNISKILIIDQDGIASEFLERYEQALPAPVKCIAVEEVSKQISAPNIVNKSNSKPSLLYNAYLCLKKISKPQLEPAAVLKRPFLKRYVKSHLAYLSLFLATFLLAAFAALQTKVYQSKQHLNRVQEEVARLKPAYQSLSEIRDKLHKTELSGETEESSIDILYNISKIKPDELYYSSINYLRNKQVTIRGYTINPNRPVEYVKSLQQEDLYTNVSLKYISQKGTKEEPIVEFQIEIMLSDE